MTDSDRTPPASGGSSASSSDLTASNATSTPSSPSTSTCASGASSSAAWTPPPLARRHSAQFGDWDTVRAEMLDIDHQQEKTVKRANYFAELRQDVTYAVRSLRNNLGFALVIVLSLAIGIGANTAIFTLIDALLLRPLPVPNADQLVVIGDSRRTNSASDGSLRFDLFSYPCLPRAPKGDALLHRARWPRGRAGRLDVMIPDSARAGGAVPPGEEHPRGRLVSGNYFAVLGVPLRSAARSRSTTTASPTASPSRC